MFIIFSMLTVSLCFLSGWSGQISLSQSAIFGLGAYTAAITTKNYNCNIYCEFIVLMMISVMSLYVISVLTRRLVEDYYLIGSLSIQYILYSLYNNIDHITRGPLGIPDIPVINIFGQNIENNASYLLFVIIIFILIIYLILSILRNPYKILVVGIKEDWLYTASLGKQVYTIKTKIFIVSGLFAVIAGAIYAHYITYIDPKSFTFEESFYVLTLVILGGMVSVYKVIIATFFYITIPELLRFVGFSENISANINQILFSIILISVIYLQETRNRNIAKYGLEN